MSLLIVVIFCHSITPVFSGIVELLYIVLLYSNMNIYQSITNGGNLPPYMTMDTCVYDHRGL